MSKAEAALEQGRHEHETVTAKIEADRAALAKRGNLVGRVHFNLAEDRKDEDAPFAFLATLPLAYQPRPSRSICRLARRCIIMRARKLKATPRVARRHQGRSPSSLSVGRLPLPPW
jgi:hypothetical protein